MKRFMTIWMWRAAGALIAMALVIYGLSGAQSQKEKPEGAASTKFDEPVALQPIERFKAAATLRSAKSAAKGAEVQVALRDWIIPNRQRVEQVREDGFLLIQIRSGEDVVTVINGDRRERKAEEFFVVPAGAKFSVETGNDSAILQVFSIHSGSNPKASKK